MDRLEKTVNDRNDELHTILRDIAVTTSHFDHTAQIVSSLEEDIEQGELEHAGFKSDIQNIKTGFSAVKWFLGLLIPLVFSIGASQFLGIWQ